jgi:hypothetical protein
MLVGESETTAGVRPTPERETDWVELATLLALSVMVTVAVRVPAADGVKVTETVQLLPFARLEPQLFV